MSNFNGYTTRSFSETQKFFVLDPQTGTPSFVLGSDLVNQLTPNSNYVFAESTRATAQATDYAVGQLIQTAGAVTEGDGLASGYLVVPSGDGDFPMDNGNELLVISGDDALREQLISNAAGEGSDLVAHTGTANTVTEALDQRVIYVGSVAEGFSGLAVLDGATLCVQSFFSGEGIGGGDFVADASAAKSLHNGITHISPTVPPVSAQSGADLAERTANFRDGAGETDPGGTGVFIRDTQGGPLLLEWAGVITDGVAENNAAVDDLIAAAPDGGVISSRASGTLLMDIPDNPDGTRYGAIRLSRGVSFVDTPNLEIKVKDFCTAHQLRVGNDVVSVVITKASNSEVRNVNLNANSDNNYFVEPDTFKWWFKAGDFAPIKGVTVYCNELEDNTESVDVYNNRILDTLHAVSFQGELADNFDSGFLDKTETQGVVVGCHAWGNTIERTRGNSLMMSSGCYDCTMHDNAIIDPQYHSQRYYNATIDCHYYDNQVFVDYDRIESRWNETDNGYYRNNDPASGEYKISRPAGVRFGSNFSYDEPTFTDNVVGCRSTNNNITFARLSVNSAIADFSGSSVLEVTRCHVDAVVKGGAVRNAPARVIVNTAASNRSADGVSITEVEVKRSSGRAIQVNNDGACVFRNHFVDCAQDETSLIRFNGSSSNIYSNRFEKTGASSTQNLADFQGDCNGLFFDSNTTRGYTGDALDTASATSVTGTGSNMPKSELSLLNGWTNTGSPNNPIGYSVDVSGLVVLSGDVSGGSSTSEVVCNLPERARPEYEQYFLASNSLDETVTCRVGKNGDVRVEETVPQSGSTRISLSFRSVRNNL